MDRAHCSLNLSRRSGQNATWFSAYAVKMTYQAADVSREMMVNSVNIFTKIYSAGPEVRKSFLQRHNLVLWGVPSIIDDNVERWNLLFETLPKETIGLITDKHSGAFFFINPALLLNIDPINFALCTEIFLPHPETAPAVDANLQNIYFSSDKLPEVTVINIKIMFPFPNASSRFVGIKVISQGISGRVQAGCAQAGLVGWKVDLPISREDVSPVDSRKRSHGALHRSRFR